MSYCILKYKRLKIEKTKIVKNVEIFEIESLNSQIYYLIFEIC